MGNWFGLPENQNISQPNLFLLKVTCQLPVMVFIFLNHFFYALYFKSHFLFKEVGLSVFWGLNTWICSKTVEEGQLFSINHHHKPHVCFLLGPRELYQPSTHSFFVFSSFCSNQNLTTGGAAFYHQFTHSFSKYVVSVCTLPSMWKPVSYDEVTTFSNLTGQKDTAIPDCKGHWVCSLYLRHNRAN